MTLLQFKKLPFDTRKMVFTDLESVILLYRLLNTFSVGHPEYVYDEDDFGAPIGVREKSGFKLPHVQIISPSEELQGMVSRLSHFDGVVAIFHNEAINGNLDKGQSLIIAIFDTLERVDEFVGAAQRVTNITPNTTPAAPSEPNGGAS